MVGDYLFQFIKGDHIVLINIIVGVLLWFPALHRLNTGHNPVRCLNVETVVRLDHLIGVGMDAI